MIETGVIRTVRGDLRMDQLARTGVMALIHEHISCDLSLGFGPEYVLQDRDLVAYELALANQKGVGLVIDVGNSGHIRDPEFLLEVSSASEVVVVASAGHYREGFFPAEVGSSSVDDLTSRMVAEIEVGIGATEVRAGAIGEVGMSDVTPTDHERKVFAA